MRRAFALRLARSTSAFGRRAPGLRSSSETIRFDLNIGPPKPVLPAMENPHPWSSHVEIARRSFAAFNRSVAEGADDFYEFLDAQIEWIPITALLDGRAYRGPEGVRRWVDDMKRHWELYEAKWEEVRDLGDGRVLAFGTWHARGRRGGVQLSFQQAAWLIDFRDGKLVRFQTFTDRRKALEAVGLSH